MPMPPRYLPDKATIDAEMATIRQTWSEDERAFRLAHGADEMVRLLASIMRPMAIEAGLVMEQQGDEPTTDGETLWWHR